MKRYYSMREVCEMFNVTRTSIKRWEEECGFPLRVTLGPVHSSKDKLGRKKRSNCRIGFPVEEVDAYDKERKDARAPSKEGSQRLVTTG